jgi:hypothetical protein
MKYQEAEKRDALLSDMKVHTPGTFNEEPATVDLPLAGDRFLPNSNDPGICTDYSEEAIPERDPAFRLPKGTLQETQTIECVSAAERIALARCLEQLGMSPARAAMVASL